MPPKKGAKKTASGYKMPEHLKEGTMLMDLKKQQWTLGRSIGVGGFGEIYIAAEGTAIPSSDSAKHVVKIEPKENGPLFVEMHFYIQVATADHVKSWSGGPVNIPLLRGQGSHQHQEDIYRFLVIDRFGVDLEKTFQNGKNPLSISLVGTLAVQIINTLEYIHSRGYTHNDIKAANLLSGMGKDCGNIYLVDFGLCVKYIKPEGHKEMKPDPRKAHDGTIEYLSRDAHSGCTARRSDLEVLCYNLYHWYTGSLPWQPHLSSPVKVQGEKEKFMSAVPGNLAHLPKSIQQLFTYVKNLKFEEKPDYQKCQGFFKAEFEQSGGKVNLSSPRKSISKDKKTPNREKIVVPKPAARAVAGKKKLTKAAADSEDEDIFATTPSPPKRPGGRGTPRGTPAGVGTPRTRGTPRTSASNPPDTNVEPEPTRAVKKMKYKEAGSQTSPNFVAKASAAKRSAKSSNDSEEDELAKKPAKKTAKKRQLQEPSGIENNPTPAMLAILKRRAEVETEKAAKKKRK